MDNRHRATTQSTVTEAESVVVASDNQADLRARRQRETAEYISEMILELRNLARAQQLYHVMVPLEYAYYEAFTASNRVDIPEADLKRIKDLSRIAQDIEKARPDS
jgi:hypothetical protein